MSRYKNFNSTGIAPDGRLYAGDLNAIQDLKADVYDLTQNIGVNAITINESGLQLTHFGALEARLSGALRTDGILRGLGGLYAGSFTTAQRNGISSGLRPYGLIILNSDTNQLEWNSGTDGTPVWRPIGVPSLVGLLNTIPPATTVAPGSIFYATDNDALYRSDGTNWLRVGARAGEIVFNLDLNPRVGLLALQGQTWPGTTGIYAELWAAWGTRWPTNLPDIRGRMPVFVGGHADVAVIGNSDSLAVANRSPIHNHAYSLTFTRALSLPVTASGPLAQHNHQPNPPTEQILQATGSGEGILRGGSNSSGTHGQNETGGVINAATQTVSGTATGTVTGPVAGTIGLAGRGTDMVAYFTLQGYAKL